MRDHIFENVYNEKIDLSLSCILGLQICHFHFAALPMGPTFKDRNCSHPSSVDPILEELYYLGKQTGSLKFVFFLAHLSRRLLGSL